MYSHKNLGRNWTVAAIFGLLLSSYCNVASGNVVDGNVLQCPTSSHPEGQRKDYRLRDSTERLRWHFNDNYENHVRPALRRLDEGDFSAPVIYDLHWTLERWPNHYIALQLTQRFEAGGGDADYYIPVSCYFERAKWFARDDANIHILQGIYEHKKGHDNLAEQSWVRALHIDHNAVEAHYNLGLLYFNQKDFSKSVEHARLAYDLGYPLPGLKSKLLKKGYWENND